MLLHQLVDRALVPLFGPMGFEHVTETYVTVSRSDIEALTLPGDVGDPQAVLTGFGPRTSTCGLMIAEPSLASAVLSRVWRSDRNEGAPLTHVEGEILRQFLARLVEVWAAAWAHEGVKVLPAFNMAGALSVLRPQLTDGRWHIARTVIRERGADRPTGVLLFCYPEALLPQLGEQARSTLWRSRIDRGLTGHEQQRLGERLAGPLRDVTITAPVRVTQQMTVGTLNTLERGDIIALETDERGLVSFNILGRDVQAHLAAHGDQIALSIESPESAAAAAEQPPPAHAAPPGGTLGATTNPDWELAAS